MKKTLILVGMLSIVYAQAQEGKVGINTASPKSALDVRGGIRVGQGLPNNDQTNLGYAFGSDGDTGLFSEADATNSNIAKSLSLYTNNKNRIFIKDDNGLVGINNTNPKVRLDVIGGGRFKRIANNSTIEIDVDNGFWGYLNLRRNDVSRWDIGLSIDEETGNNTGSDFYISSAKDDGSFLYRAFTISRESGNTGIGTDNPEAKLDVAGEIIARGQNKTDAYFGGDNFPAVPGRAMNDVEIGSIKAGVTDISLYNRADAKTMNLFANDLNAAGNVKSNTLSGDGDKIVMANNDGTLIKGVSISNFATSNIYTADGTLTGDRKVTMGDKILSFEGNNGAKYLEVKNASWYPLVVNSTNSQGGGIAVHPNNLENRAEFSVNERGDIRFYQNGSGDVIFVEKNGSLGGFVGINNTNPKVRLDVIGGGRFKRVGSSSTIEIDTDNNQWGHLDFRRNDVKRWDIGMTNGEETGGEAGSNFFITSFKDDGSFNASGLFINRKTGYTGIGTSNPESGLDVAGEIIARGQNQTDAYFGGDNVPAVPGRPMNDVEIGSIKAGVTDISLYNRTDGKSMNLFANELNAGGNIKSTTLSGDGDKIVIANNEGTLIKGVSISNFATSNIYTADGTLTGDRIVNTGDNDLTIKGNSWFPLIVQSTIDAGVGNKASGGIAIYADDFNKRIELATTKEGDIRLWGGTGVSKLYIDRASGNTGISTDEPKAKLDVRGGIRAVQGYPQGDDTNLGYAFGTDGDTGLFAIADPTNNNVGTGLDLYLNNVSRLNINQQGDVKVTNLSGDGDKIVMANNDGTLTKGVSISNFATSNIYTANGTLTSNRVVDQAGKWLDFNNGGITITGNDGVYFPLSINTKHSGGNGGIAINPNGDNAKRVELNSTPEGDFRLWAGGDKIYVNRSTGNVGLSVGTNPAARLDVSGELIARGQTGEIEAYFGGDGVGGDVEVGSIKAGVTDVTLYNRGDSKAMNLVSGNVDARGTIKSTTLSGDGDKIVIANNDGTLVKGVSVNNFVTTNIYTADGSTNGDRTVSTANGFLTIKGNAWNPLVVNSEIVPSDPANNSRGGLAVHPNDMEKRVEFATTKDGDSRIWLDGDKVFIKRATGNVGIGTVDPQAKLDVSGDVRTNAVIYNSDARLKTNVENISNATATINGLRSVTYTWNELGKQKGGNEKLQYGFLAQEVEKVLPTLVNTDEQGYKSVNYVAVVPVLVKALQEKDEELKALKAEVEAIKKALKK